MRIVITGASGFIGNQLTKELKKDKTLELIPLTRNIHSDFYSDYSLQSLKKWLVDTDVVVHLAAKRGGNGNFQEYLENAVLAENVALASKDNEVKKLIYISSISAYCNQTTLPWKESERNMPTNFYGLSKVVGEEIFQLHLNQTETSLYILRLAHVFGAHERNNYMINLFIRQAFNQQELVLSNLTEAKREFLYIKDAVRAIKLSILHQSNQQKCFVLNIGSMNSLTNLEIGKVINQVFKNSKMTICGTISSDTVMSSYMDHSLAEKIIGYTAQYTMNTALTEIKEEMEGMEEDVPIFY